MKPEYSDRRAPRKEIFGWAMFDFANSAYTTVIITVVFADIFPRLIVGPDAIQTGAQTEYRHGNFLWSIAQIIGYTLVVLTAPIFGAIMDYSASKKKFLFISYLITVIATASLFFVGPGNHLLGMLLIATSLFGFAAGENFVSSFLPELGPPEDLGKISAYGWALGYFGGLAATLLVTMLGTPELGNFSSLRFVGPITGLFFLIAAIPTFLFVKERGVSRREATGQGIAGEISFYVKMGFGRLFKTMREIHEYRDLAIFLASVFFAMAGLSIVIAFAFIYGRQVVGWSDSTRNLMFIVTQFSAAGGAFVFGHIQDRIGAKKTFNITLTLWIVCIFMIWGTNDIAAFMNQLLGLDWKAEYYFVFIGSIAGLGLGATQSASRAIVGIFSPDSKSGEFFGFWGLSGKLAAIVGLLGLALLQRSFGLERSILLCSVFFAIALLINLTVNEERGKQKAREHEGE